MIRPYYLLDSNLISEILKLSPDKVVCKKMIEYQNLCALPSTVWNELIYGVNILEQGKRKDFLFSKIIKDVQSTFEIIQYDNHAAWIQADIRARLKQVGTPVDFPDTQIASIAVANNMILVTRNIKHFEPIQQVCPLMLENWFKA